MDDIRMLDEFKDIKCEVCGKQVTSIARCKYLCKLCYNILSRDNARLFAEDKEIPNDISYLKSCKRYNCNNKFIRIIKYEGDDIIPEYCSEECKLRDEDIKLRKNW